MEPTTDYEDYLSVSAFYDKWRVPVGLDSLDRALETAARGVGTSKDSLKLLDVGCGTGNYIDALKDKVGSCTGLEYNEGMLKRSNSKHQGDDRVRLYQGSATNMDQFEAETFDVVITTQMLHHLSLEMQCKVLENIHRVLKKGGVMWISTATPLQCMEGTWYAALVPQAAAICGAKFPGIFQLKKDIAKAGFKIINIENPADTLIPTDKYLDPNGPLKDDYRMSDSLWTLASNEELEAGLAWWKKQVESGLAEEFLKEREKQRLRVGQTLAVTCVKD